MDDLHREPSGTRPKRLFVRTVWLILLVWACGPGERRSAPLPERTVPPDTSALTPGIRAEGGAILLELTGWVNAGAIEEFVAAGLEPLPGYETVEALDSMGQNVIGGTVTPEALSRVLALRYIVEIRPADVDE